MQNKILIKIENALCTWREEQTSIYIMKIYRYLYLRHKKLKDFTIAMRIQTKNYLSMR